MNRLPTVCVAFPYCSSEYLFFKKRNNNNKHCMLRQNLVVGTNTVCCNATLLQVQTQSPENNFSWGFQLREEADHIDAVMRVDSVGFTIRYPIDSTVFGDIIS